MHHLEFPARLEKPEGDCPSASDSGGSSFARTIGNVPAMTEGDDKDGWDKACDVIWWFALMVLAIVLVCLIKVMFT
jgi:hypothetical protein